jgi:hypothetical protein
MSGISEQQHLTNPQQMQIAVSRIDRFLKLDVLTATNKELLSLILLVFLFCLRKTYRMWGK